MVFHAKGGGRKVRSLPRKFVPPFEIQGKQTLSPVCPRPLGHSKKFMQKKFVLVFWPLTRGQSGEVLKYLSLSEQGYGCGPHDADVSDRLGGAAWLFSRLCEQE